MEELVYNRQLYKNQQYIFLVVIIVFSFMVPFSLIKWKAIPPQQPRVSNGVINLEKWNFLKFGSVRLDGQWRFKLVTNDFYFSNYHYVDRDTDDDKGKGWIDINIPTSNYYITEDDNGTYCGLRFFIILPPVKQRGRLLFSYSSDQMPAQIRIGDIEPRISGTERLVEKKISVTIPEEPDTMLVAIRIPNIPPSTNALNIKAEITALDYAAPGREGETFYLAMVAGIMLIMIIFHFMLWFENREDKASLFLMLYSLVVFCRVVSTYVLTEKLFADTAWAAVSEINRKLLYLNHPLGWVFFLTFLFMLLREENDNVILFLFQVAGILMSLVILIANNYQLIAVINRVLTCLACLWISQFLVKAVRQKKEGAGIILAGIAVYAITVIYDILLDYLRIGIVYLSEWGFVIFLFFYSRYQSLFFTRASRKAHYLAANIAKEIEKQTYTLKKQKSELERVNRVLDSQKRKLEEVNTKQREIDEARIAFFHNISHAFRNPLALILAPLESALAGKFGALNPELQKYLEIIRENSLEILTLINQVLELARIEGGKVILEPEKTDLVLLFKYITTSFESLAVYRNIAYRVEAPGNSFYTCVDRKKTGEILTNLLSNAFKFTDNGGMVTVILEAGGKTADGHSLHDIVLTVKDTGIGIAEKDLPHIFDRFWQADNSLTRRYKGTGIGLSLVKEYTSLLGGTIDVHSAPGKGTEFIVRITVECPGYSKESSAGEQPPGMYPVLAKQAGSGEHYPAAVLPDPGVTDDGERQRILIIEDNPDMRGYMRNELSAKYRVDEAAHGRDGLEKLAKLPKPDLILCDVMMEEMDGFSFYKTISADPELNMIPVIFLTARADIAERLKGLALGAVDYVYKPFHPAELFFKINALLKNQKLKLAYYEKDKYASIGMLFGGILHEISNPLSGIYAPVENLQRNLARMALLENPKLQNYFKDIFSSLERIEKLVKSSKLLFHRKEGENEEINIEQLLASIRDIFYNKIKNRINFITTVDKDVKIFSDYDALTHILINLVSNAIDAVKFRGDITVRVFTINDKPVIVVKDTGTGIKKENLGRIFEPFYTEKEAGKGTGMGLYLVKTLVLKIGWTIEVFSEEGKGSEFMLSCG